MTVKQTSPITTASTNAGVIPIPLEGQLTINRVLVNNLAFPDIRTVVSLSVYLQEAPTGSSTTLRLSNTTAGTSASVSVTAGSNSGNATVSLYFAASDVYKVDVTAIGSTFAGSTGTLFIR